MPECLLKRKNPKAFWLWQESVQLKEGIQSSVVLPEKNKNIAMERKQYSASFTFARD
jgi:hypothetical protein